ncbi:lipopolysaccharide core heptose(II) kinase RfaY [Siccibacter turicensis]
MITKTKINDFVVYVKDNDTFFTGLFEDFLHYRLDVVKVFRSIEDTKVVLIDTPRGKFVLKVFAPKDKKFERVAKSFVKGDYYYTLLKQTDRVINEGLRFPNDFYLLAERKIFNYASLFVMIIEYVEGVELADLSEIDDDVRAEIAEKMQLLHQHNMISGDPHKGNFILSADGIRIIDLSGKTPTANRKAKDRIDMERHLGIENELKDLGYYSVVYKKRVRLKIKRIKQRLKLSK